MPRLVILYIGLKSYGQNDIGQKCILDITDSLPIFS